MITPEKLLESAKELETQLRTWRRTLHRHPEVGFDLPETKALVKKALTEMGYAPQDCGKCGVLALAGGKRPGKTILLDVYKRQALTVTCNIQMDLSVLGEINTAARMCIWNK